MDNLDEFSFRKNLLLSQRKERRKFGNHIRDKRREKNLSIADLSVKAKISQELILRIESGLVDPDIKSIVRRLDYALTSELLIIS
jgi:predicted transcriptional regulator